MADGRAWGVCWLMFAATVLTYMDRQTVALLGEPIKAEFRITVDADFGWVLSAFYVTYALFQVLAGYLVDRWDLRRTYALAVAWWSLAAAATAIVPSLGLLIACRALLGVGESFNWPVALRVTARVLPPSDRSLGNGIFNSGAAIGAVITPAVVTYLAERFGWRSSFAVIGSAGFVWVAAWLFLVRGELRRSLAPPTRKDRAADPLDAGPLERAARRRLRGLRRRPGRGRGRGDGRIPIRIRRRPGGDRRGDRRPAPGRGRSCRATGSRRRRVGRRPRRGRPEPPILDPGGGLGHDQHLLALPGELDPVAISSRSGSWPSRGRQLPQHDPVPGRRRRQSPRGLAVATARRGRPARRAGPAARHGRRDADDHGRARASGSPRTSRPRSSSSR